MEIVYITANWTSVWNPQFDPLFLRRHNDEISLSSCGTISLSLGPKQANDSIPYFVE